jgi:hypothetical protein
MTHRRRAEVPGMGQSLQRRLHPDGCQPGFQAIEISVRLEFSVTSGNLDWTTGRN